MIEIRELNEVALSEAFGEHVAKLFTVLLSGENFNSDAKFSEAIVRFMRGYNNGLRALTAILEELETELQSKADSGEIQVDS
jgi:hypothetical protein